MPPINLFRCSKCDLALSPAWGGCLYVIDDDGNRVTCAHPGERETVEAVLGKNAPIEVVKARKGFNSDTLYLSCLSQFRMDKDWDERICPECGSIDVKTSKELVGESCPRCGVETIREIRTGIVA